MNFAQYDTSPPQPCTKYVLRPWTRQMYDPLNQGGGECEKNRFSYELLKN